MRQNKLTHSTLNPGLPVLEIQTLSIWQTLAIPLRQSGTVERRKRKRLVRLQSDHAADYAPAHAANAHLAHASHHDLMV